MKTMLKRLSIIVAALCLSWSVSAQQTYTAKDMVGITPMLSSYLDLPSDAVRSLDMKLKQMVTQNGMGATSNQFILTANTVVLDKQVTATAPAQFIVELEVSFFVLNLVDNVIVDEMSYTVKGIDRLENKAVIQAINQIKPKSPQVRQFMDNTRESIITYYNTRIPAIVAKAQSLAAREEYYEAIYLLSGVPECVDQYPMVAEQMSAIYLKMLDYEAAAAIQEAKGFVAIRDYESAIYALRGVNPVSGKSKDAMAVIEQIKSKIDADEQRKIDEELKKYEDAKEAAQRQHDDNVMLTKMAIEAGQKIGVEKAKTETNVSQSLNKWFLGKFK